MCDAGKFMNIIESRSRAFFTKWRVDEIKREAETSFRKNAESTQDEARPVANGMGWRSGAG